MTYFESLIHHLSEKDSELAEQVESMVQKAYYQGFTDGRQDSMTGHGSQHGWHLFVCSVRPGGLFPFGRRG